MVEGGDLVAGCILVVVCGFVVFGVLVVVLLWCFLFLLFEGVGELWVLTGAGTSLGSGVFLV